MAEIEEETADPVIDDGTDPEGEGTDDGDAEGEAEGSTQSAAVPLPRFKKVLGERNALRELTQSLETRLAELEARAAAAVETDDSPTPETQTEPPTTLSPQQKVQWYVEKYAGEMIQKQLGMSLAEAATALKSVVPVSQDYAQRAWTEMCSGAGLDPNDKQVQELAMGLVQGAGKQPKDAVATIAKLMGKKPTEPASDLGPPKQNGTMTVSRILPKDKHQAADMARRGVRSDKVSILDIIRASAANGAK